MNIFLSNRTVNSCLSSTPAQYTLSEAGLINEGMHAGDYPIAVFRIKDLVCVNSLSYCFNCAWVRVRVHMRALVSAETRGVRSPGVSGCCESLDVGAENYLWPSVREMHASNH